MARSSALQLFSLAGALVILTAFTTSKKPMPLAPPVNAPTFTIPDVDGRTIDLAAYRGRPVYLAFHRNVGCPICNLRFHQVEERMAEFQAEGLVVIAIYESSADSMRSYLDGERPRTIMIPDPQERLYSLYQVERSMGKMMKGMLHGAMGKMADGKKLFRKKMKQDGHMDRIGADFLINPDGTLHTAYYGKFVGDNLPLDSIGAFLR